MKILLSGLGGIDGVSTFVYDLATVLSEENEIYFHGKNPFIQFTGNIFEENKLKKTKYDGAIINYFKPFTEIKCKKIYHTHLAEIKGGYADNIKSVIDTDENFILTVNSLFQKQQLMNMGLEAKKIELLPNFVNENLYKPNSKADKIPNSILLVSRIAENTIKIWKPMIIAMKYLPEYTLTIMGTVSDKVKRQFDRLIKENNRSNIKYIEPQMNTEKAKTINQYEIGVGVGRSAREMVLCGLPVMIFRESFGGWVKDDNLSIYEKDNFTTRWMVEQSEETIIKGIVENVRNPEKCDLIKAINSFGMKKNINKIKKLLG